ncbi:MAG: hypothetical protein QGI42_03595, partial [Rhodospirillales bacterium]|nr:hypothetical protein [Rhodospirillales bacterium]
SFEEFSLQSHPMTQCLLLAKSRNQNRCRLTTALERQADKRKSLPRHASANHLDRQDRLSDAIHSNSTCRVEEPIFPAPGGIGAGACDGIKDVA